MYFNPDHTQIFYPQARAGSATGFGQASPFETPHHRLQHELRTPLNHIMGFAGLLSLDASLSPSQRGWVEAIISGAEEMLASIVFHTDGAEK